MSEPESRRQDSRRSGRATSHQVRDAIEGDLDALSRLVTRFSPVLLAHARYRMGAVLRRRCDPEEVVQDAWLVALPKLASLRSREGRYTPVLLSFLSSTILRLIRNLARRHVQDARGGSADDEDPDPMQELPAEQTGIVTKAVRFEVVTEVHRQLDRLGDLDRQIVILRGIEQQSNITVGVMLELEPKTVSKRYHRALDRLRTQMPGSVFDEFDDEPGE